MPVIMTPPSLPILLSLQIDYEKSRGIERSLLAVRAPQAATPPPRRDQRNEPPPLHTIVQLFSTCLQIAYWRRGCMGKDHIHCSRRGSGPGRVSRVSPVQTAVRNCTRDEGRPFGFGDQVADPKPPRAAAVKSRGGERRGNVGTMIPAGEVERGERKQTASEASKAD